MTTLSIILNFNNNGPNNSIYKICVCKIIRSGGHKECILRHGNSAPPPFASMATPSLNLVSSPTIRGLVDHMYRCTNASPGVFRFVLRLLFHSCAPGCPAFKVFPSGNQTQRLPSHNIPGQAGSQARRCRRLRRCRGRRRTPARGAVLEGRRRRAILRATGAAHRNPNPVGHVNDTNGFFELNTTASWAR